MPDRVDFLKADRHAGNGDACFNQRIDAIAKIFLLCAKDARILKVHSVIIDSGVEKSAGNQLKQTKYRQGNDDAGDDTYIFEHIMGPGKRQSC
jgi:hypothetical protein